MYICLECKTGWQVCTLDLHSTPHTVAKMIRKSSTMKKVRVPTKFTRLASPSLASQTLFTYGSVGEECLARETKYDLEAASLITESIRSYVFH